MSFDRRGVSFIEISLATIVLAVALIPVFGLIQGGLIRSDVSTSYSAATELASSLMNKLLGDALPFDDIPESPGGEYGKPGGSVANDSKLDQLFIDSGWAIDGQGRARTKDNIRYKAELWVENFDGDDDLQFRYLENPNVDYNQATPYNSFYPKMMLTAADWAFSPYNSSQAKGNKLDANAPGSAWASKVILVNQMTVRKKIVPGAAVVHQNFKKLLIRISWSGKATGRKALGDASKEFWLISFRANLGGTS